MVRDPTRLSCGSTQWCFAGLPKTRSGKILRRVLRKIATNEENQLGDLSTLNDPEVINQLLGKLTLALPLP